MGPIIKIRIDHMKHELATHLAGYHEQWTKQAQEAIEAALTPERVAKVIRETLRPRVEESVQHLVASAVSRAMRDPELRRAIDDAVLRALKDAEP